MLDQTIFDKDYPITEDGIVQALPTDLAYEIPVNTDAKTFDDVHREVMIGREDKRFLTDSGAMAQLQKEFYDRMASGFQQMDDNDLTSGGLFWKKIYRHARYDLKHFRPHRLLFVGAGNCRLARIFAYLGFNVVATDISLNMLRIGKRIADGLGIDMAYVCQNAEIPFPFKSEQFDTVYSLCVMNHIVNWRNYVGEKLRCLAPGGIVYERLPNGTLWDFWQTQGSINEGIEARVVDCIPEKIQRDIETWFHLPAQVWTHDRQIKLTIDRPIEMTEREYVKADRRSYEDKAYTEDQTPPEQLTDDAGIYTIFKILKP